MVGERQTGLNGCHSELLVPPEWRKEMYAGLGEGR